MMFLDFSGAELILRLILHTYLRTIATTSYTLGQVVQSFSSLHIAKNLD